MSNLAVVYKHDIREHLGRLSEELKEVVAVSEEKIQERS